MRYRLGRVAAVPSALLLALTIVTAVGFRRVYENWSFLAFYVTVAIAVHAITALCRFLRVHILAATPLALLTGLCVIALKMYPSSVQLGFLPSASSFRLAADDISLSWREFTSTVAPVPPTGGFLLLGALAIVIVAYASDTFALRAFGRVEAVIPSAVLFTFVSVLGEPGYRIGRVWITAAWMFVGCLTVALVRDEHGEVAQSWLGGRHAVRLARTGLAAALMSLAAAGLAYAVAPQLPGAKEVGLIDTSPRSGDDSSSSSVSPLVDIRGRLTGNPNRIMFRVTSKRAAYWRLTSLPDFNGKVWQTNESFSDVDSTLRAKPKGTSVRQSVTIENMGEGWVPAAFEPVAISGDVSFVYNPESATVRLADGKSMSRGLEYSVTSVIGSYSVRQLNRASVKKPPSDRYLTLPDNYPDDLREIAANVVEGKTSAYQRAVALQDWFREEFTYDLDVSYGSGISAMREFLVARRGYCEQFATTFAAFARSLGIPSRVAIGFTPGVIDEGRYVVRARNAHAWPEVWFDGVGWVSFEPTPGRGAPGTEQYTGVQPAQDETVGPDTDDGSGGNDTVPDTSVPTTDGSPSPETTAVPSGAASGPSGASGAGIPTTSTSPNDTTPNDGRLPNEGGGSALTWIIVVLVLLALGAGVYAWLVLLPPALAQRRRRAIGDEPADRVLASWQDVTSLLALFGAARRAEETPLEHAARTHTLTSTHGVDHAAIDRLADLATQALYARDSVDEERAVAGEDLAASLGRDVVAAAHGRLRWRLRLDPRLSSRLHR